VTTWCNRTYLIEDWLIQTENVYKISCIHTIERNDESERTIRCTTCVYRIPAGGNDCFAHKINFQRSIDGGEWSKMVTKNDDSMKRIDQPFDIQVHPPSTRCGPHQPYLASHPNVVIRRSNRKLTQAGHFLRILSRLADLCDQVMMYQCFYQNITPS
jgi:hypothetical protein